jgi:isoleucyl-tRNA synthetase
MLPFTMEEAWLDRYPDAASVHLEQFPAVPANWQDEALAGKWRRLRDVRRVVTGALEIERAAKSIGSSLEAAPVLHIADAGLRDLVEGADMAEICITSAIEVIGAPAPASAFALEDVPGVAVEFRRAEQLGLTRCARSWRYTDDVGSDATFPDVSARDAAALRELQALGRL